MGSYSSEPDGADALSERFPTTQWGVVAAAALTDAESRRALATLCQRYWYPLYACIRHMGHCADEAEDLTQSFFVMLLENELLRHADPGRGKFRTYLLAALQNFLADESDRARAAKRGGRRQAISLDSTLAESRYAVEPSDDRSPERLFDRQWAQNVLNLALADLRAEFSEEGKMRLFDSLWPHVTGEHSDIKYGQLGVELGMTTGAVRVAVHRLRRRFGSLLRDQIAQTLESPGDVDDEIRHLLTLLRR